MRSWSEALQHAAEAGLEQRTCLLLARGVDPGTHPIYEGRSPYEGAVLHGNLAIAELLAAAGADTSTVDALTVFVGACLAGDRRATDAKLAADPRLLQSALEQRGDLVARAAELGRGDAIRLLVDLGFDVNARHRTTALHEAAQHGNLQLAKLLVELGADPSVVDTEWDSPPAGWARHAGHTNVADYLDGLSLLDCAGGTPITMPLEACLPPVLLGWPTCSSKASRSSPVCPALDGSIQLSLWPLFGARSPRPRLGLRPARLRLCWNDWSAPVYPAVPHTMHWWPKRHAGPGWRCIPLIQGLDPPTTPLE